MKERFDNYITNIVVKSIAFVMSTIFLLFSGMTTYFVKGSYTKMSKMEDIYFEIREVTIDNAEVNRQAAIDMVNSLKSHSDKATIMYDSVNMNTKDIINLKVEVKKIKKHGIGLF